jgi:hypothetical protein
LRHLGRWLDMQAERAEHLRDAARRGDRYAETTLSRGINLAWLVSDEPARARKELELATWTPPQGGYHMQHWYELRARIELALYEDDVAAARQQLADGFGPLQRSLLQRAQTLRTDAIWLRGRAALFSVAEGGPREHLDLAVAAAQALWREGVSYAGPGPASRGRDHRSAATPPRPGPARRASGSDEADLRMCAAAASWPATCGRAMLGEVKQPGYFVAVLIPGWQPAPDAEPSRFLNVLLWVDGVGATDK